MRFMDMDSSHLADAPGVYYDGQLRLFRLRCKDSLYAFRVDDSRNLEHLYWGPPLPPSDDITYLIRSHVHSPFDPRGSISIAKVLGLDELGDIGNVEDITEKWRVFTAKAKDVDESEDKLRSRRLENASWRLWHQERNRGGDLNRDTVADALKELSIETEGKTSKSQPEKPHVSFDQHLNGPSEPDHEPAPNTQKAKPKGLGMRRSLTSAKSMVNVASLSMEHVPTGSRDTPVPKAPASPLSRPRPTFENRTFQQPKGHSGSSSPIMRKPSSQAFSPVAGSFGELSRQEQNTNWGALDAEVLGKNTKLLEFSDFGTGDYRDPSFKLTFHRDGSSVCPLEYRGHKIVQGKVPMPSPMPALYTDSTEEATTLIVDLEDILTGIRFLLYYTVMHDYDIITRRTVVVNNGSHPVTLRHIVSGTFDFDAEESYYLLQLAGGWARERSVCTQRLDYGVSVVKSTRGASSHQFNPFIVISPREEPQEDHGEVFGFGLVYSGNFAATTEISEYGRLRVNMGINQEGFTWHLSNEKGCNQFHTPEVVMTYSREGLGHMSRTLHRVIRERLVPRLFRYKVQPVLINTWEAAYFEINHEIVVEIARSAAKANIELLVLDDGWFGVRHNTLSGLGDWYPNPSKFPFGIEATARAVNECGLLFGIWVEPEMVSIDSDLYRKHPDWCLCVPMRNRTTGRNQLVLDFSRQVVRDHIFNELYKLFSRANVAFVKWDMNRHLTEVFSQEWHKERQGEVSHRFILGVYEVFGRLTEAFPNVLFESCSGGGGRFDLGMLYFSPQVWASDNTDALSRVAIQYGTSLAYPAPTMGAHVSTVPNHQTLRTTPMKTRCVVAMSGTFGFELDPREFSEDDIKEVIGYIELRNRMAPLVNEGDLYRLWSPFKLESAAWMFVSRNRRRSMVIAVNIRRLVGRLLPRLKLRGLDPDLVYQIEELCPGTVIRNSDTGAIDNAPFSVYQYGEPLQITGRTLMNAGLPVKFLFDADSLLIELNAERLATVPQTLGDQKLR